MNKPIRMTFATAMVLQALDRGYRYGFDILDATGLRSGTVYPLLRRFEAVKLVKTRWEPISIARSEHRPPRKYYQLTGAAESLVEEAKNRFPALESIPSSEPEASGR